MCAEEHHLTGWPPFKSSIDDTVIGRLVHCIILLHALIQPEAREVQEGWAQFIVIITCLYIPMFCKHVATTISTFPSVQVILPVCMTLLAM